MIEDGVFRLQVVSDLYLEMIPDRAILYRLIKPSAPYLVLVCNLCVTQSNTTKALNRVACVCIQAGNIGCPGIDSRLAMGWNSIAIFCCTVCAAKPNLVFLNRTSAVIGNVRLIGELI